jgi:two-component system, sensor histidine kinase and response regulator
MRPQVLVIEDSRTQSKILTDLLLDNECQPTPALTGEDARKHYNNSTFDIILLDMVLPDASGLQLLQEIRASSKCINTPVIILSGVTDKGNIVDALSLGATDYLAKPFHQSEFLSRLNLHLGMQKANRILQETVTAKNKLISVLAHDLKDPFNGLLGFTKLLVDGHRTFDEVVRNQYINQVYHSAIGMHELLQNLTLWAGVESRGATPVKNLVQPHLLIDQAISVLKAATDFRKVTLVTTLDQEQTLHADAHMLSSIFRNLISNCSRFLGPGQTMTVLSLPKEENGEKGLEFSIQLSRGEFPQTLLQATSQAIKTTGPDGQNGLGLGLSLSIDFVRAHRGTISFENISGEGKVRFFMPLGG